MNPTTPLPLPPLPASRRGIALLTVLALLTLTALLILAFFSIAQTELKSTSAYAGGAEAQQLSKTALDLVIHQIRAATEESGTAWASQPGMIRTWGKHQGQEHVAAFKLYSDDEMTVRERISDPHKVPSNFARALHQDFDDLKDWHQDRNKDVFVDLNEPILRTHVDRSGRESVNTYYPIVDPRAYVKGAQQSMVTRSDWNSPSTKREDIEREIEGFFFETQTVSRGDYPKKDGNRIDHYVGLPMPVRWIYQLKDGTLGALVSTGGTPNFKAISGDGTPSQANPMVARFAFWADDETSKLNVNTAAGGRPWDTPRAAGVIDRQYGELQAVQKEFQRYPAHPATTSLLPVIFPNRPKYGAGGYSVAPREKIYELVPRVTGGGSQNGAPGGIQRWSTDKPPIIQTDRDRLYATIDEFIFQFPKTANSTSQFREPHEALPGWGTLDGEFLDRAKFFLTANSRAPEVTVFNTPRLSMWPTHYSSNFSSYTNSNRYSEFDRRIRFCAELGDFPNNFGHQYHFQRINSESRTADFNDIDRNQDLFAYLVWMMRQDIPGIGKSFQDKYAARGNQQIATQIFDYIRATNLFDDTLFVFKEDSPPLYGAPFPPVKGSGPAKQTPWTSNPANHIAYTNNRAEIKNEDRWQHTGHGQVVPIEIRMGGTTTKGMGRFYTINEVGIAFITCAYRPKPNGAGYSMESDDDFAGKEFRYYRDDQTSRSWFDNPRDYTNVPPWSRADLLQWTNEWTTLADFNNLEPLVRVQWIIDFKFILDKYLPGWSAVKTDDEIVQRWEGKRDLWNYLRNPNNWNHTLAQDQPLAPGGRVIQSCLLFSAFCPSRGWTALNPDFRMEVELSGSWSVDGNSLFSHAMGNRIWRSNADNYRYWGHRENGGMLEPRVFMIGQGGPNNAPHSNNPRWTPDYSPLLDSIRPEAGPKAAACVYKPSSGVQPDEIFDYPWVSSPIRLDGNFNLAEEELTMSFSGGDIEIRLYGGDGNNSDSDNPNQGSSDYSQQVSIAMQGVTVPRPDISEGATGEMRGPNASNLRPVPNSMVDAREDWTFHRLGAFRGPASDGITYTGRQVQSGGRAAGRFFRVRNHPTYDGGIIGRKGDVLRSYVVPHGDYRLTMAKRELDSSDNPDDVRADFVPHKDYNDSSAYNAASYFIAARATGYGTTQGGRKLVSASNTPNSFNAQIPPNYSSNHNVWGDYDNGIASEIDGPFINKPDEGNSRGIDNLFHIRQEYVNYGWVPRPAVPYFSDPEWHEAAGASFYSPNRIMPGPGVIGSLPTGVVDGRPWQTLLFRPLVNAGRAGGQTHPGYEDPKDHYLLDFFWMPVVEPWSISEPFSTAGKVNLNYAMAPFSHIKRASALYGVFESEEFLTVPNDLGTAYKAGQGYGANYNLILHTGGTMRFQSLRSWINSAETLRQFDAKFNSPALSGDSGAGDIFRTASQICENWLVPYPVAYSDAHPIFNRNLKLEDMERAWDPGNPRGFGLVGDNSRERPYTNLLARLTTKSNTFQVHYRAQVIKQSPMSLSRPGERRKDEEFATFDSDLDGVVAEYRGSSILERFIDPNEAINDGDASKRLPDYAKLARSNALNPGQYNALDKFYRFRVVSEKRFAP